MTYLVEVRDARSGRWRSISQATDDRSHALELMLASARDGREHRVVAVGAGEDGDDLMVAGALFSREDS